MKNVVVPMSVSRLKSVPTLRGFVTYSFHTSSLLWHHGGPSGRFDESLACMVEQPRLFLPNQSWVCVEWVIPVTPGTNYRSNVVFSVELESFTLKNTVIKTGSNVLNNNAELQLTYFQASLVPFNLMFFAVYNCFLVIHPETGVTTMEF